VSYTINGILQNEVNVIFINGKQVYCYNDKDKNGEGNSVYVAIYEYPNSSNSSVPKLWKDGVFTNLSNSTGRAYATSVYVFGNDVYLAGHKDAFIPFNNQTYLVSYAQLWKNGEELTIGSEYSQATSVFVANNNDVYVAGYEYVIQDAGALKSAGFSPFEPDFVCKYQLPEKAAAVTKSSSLDAKRQCFATLWKNGKAQYLTDGNYLALAYSVYVTGNDVYVAGEERNAQGKSVAKLWKNGNVQNLTDGSYSAGAKAVFVKGNDVYVAGYEHNAQGMSVAKVWKNGAAQNLTNGTTLHGWAHDVYVSGNDVYVVGSEINITQQGGGHVAQLWKNGVSQNLPDDRNTTSQAHSVCVSGNDVYVSGHGQQNKDACTVAKLWKNGVVQNLTDGSKSGLAYSVFVKSVMNSKFDNEFSEIVENNKLK
jgi:hypothetical protein